MPDASQPASQRGPTLSRRTLWHGFAALPFAWLGGVAIARAGGGPHRTVSQPDGAADRSRLAVAAPDCVATPALTEGPYFVDEQLLRADIRSDPASGAVREGAPLRLGCRVLDVAGNACAPIAGAVVDVWQCDALGRYSDVRDPGFSTLGQRFLRGAQLTDENGSVEFLTIYPGWYPGRAVHIHFKVRTDPGAARGHEFTSQVFFDDALTDQVHAQPPYAAKGQRTLRNDGDFIYRQGGQQLVLNATPTDDGYAASFAIGVDRSVLAAVSPGDATVPSAG